MINRKISINLKKTTKGNVLYTLLCGVIIMAKILCEFDSKQIECKVTENMGYQGGDYVKAVEHDGKERIVVKRGQIWRPKTVIEKCGMRGQ